MWVITNLCIHNSYLINLTMGLTFWYTMYIMKKQGDIMIQKLKELGLLDADFLQPLVALTVLIVIGEVL